MNYLNVEDPFIAFQDALYHPAFVDKSLLIDVINHQMKKRYKYICLTRPRRFGKTINASMLSAYYTRGFDNSGLFKGLAVEGTDSYREHLNQHNVIYIDFSVLPDDCKSYDDYIKDIRKKLRKDILQCYTNIVDDNDFSLIDLLKQTKDSFIFILDEWDSIFYKDFMKKEDKAGYLEFLKGLLKDKPYVELAYMTGVLPVIKYSSGSELNMFKEYNFINDNLFDRFFGFTEFEVKELCGRLHSVSFDELKEWYDGYSTLGGESLFNPRSVCFALDEGLCQSYWTQTGPMNEIADCIKYNVDAVRDDMIKLVSGIPVELEGELQIYGAAEPLVTRNEILSAMIVFGFLTYKDKILRIPNKELMLKFQSVLQNGVFGGVSEIIARSKEMLKATLAKDAKKVAEILEDAHDSEIPVLQYNDENSLACIVSLCYLYARDYYKIKREEPAGKGFCDFTFHPKIKGEPGIILELKCDGSCDKALAQIKDHNYVKALEDCPEVLLVGINYDRKKKVHECKIEVCEKNLMKEV